MPSEEIILKCKSCRQEWAQEKLDAQTLYYCPKCGTIGHLHKQFDNIYGILFVYCGVELNIILVFIIKRELQNSFSIFD